MSCRRCVPEITEHQAGKQGIIVPLSRECIILRGMGKIKHVTQLIVLDTLAVIFMLLALATGWLPGPGGIPLFIIGLSLLAVNHEWAERYIDLLKEYADKVSDLIFIPKLRGFFDVLAPVMFAGGTLFIIYQSAIWMISFGIFCIGMSLVTFFGNRNRWARFKKWLKKALASKK
jgi:hypothetical protein